MLFWGVASCTVMCLFYWQTHMFDCYTCVAGVLPTHTCSKKIQQSVTLSLLTKKKKKVGCFNHGVVSLVAAKLRRQRLGEVLETIIVQGNQHPDHLTTFILLATLKWICKDSPTDILRVISVLWL